MTEDNLLNTEIPEKFKDPETGELQVDLLLSSYQELEKNNLTYYKRQRHQKNTPSIVTTACSNLI